MGYAKQMITVNTDTRRACLSAARPTSPAATSIKLFDAEVRVVCFTFVDSTGAAVAFPADGTYSFHVDYEREAKLGSLCMLNVGNSDINNIADWSEANPALGKISVKCNCSSMYFDAGLDPVDGEIDVWCQMRLVPNGETNSSTMFLDAGRAYGTVAGRYR